MEAFIIVAGGKGLRVGGPIPKQFIELDGKPVLMHTIETFYQYNPQAQLILVLPSSHLEFWNSLCEQYQFHIKHQIIEGGEERFFSVKNALLAVDDADFVSIHDGVRPLLSQDLIKRCMTEVKKKLAVIPVVPLNDSVRKLQGHESTPVDRASLMLVQTPQVFHYPKLMMAYRTAFKKEFTDDASVWEAAGRKISLINGEQENIKITRALDFKLAELFLEEKKISQS